MSETGTLVTSEVAAGVLSNAGACFNFLRMVKSALRNPYAIIVMALALLVIGVVALMRTPTDLLPQFKTPAVQVLTMYPGMPAEVMEKDITSRIERWTGQSNGIT